jgi:hypothetical protein
MAVQNEIEHFECNCHSENHVIRIRYHSEDHNTTLPDYYTINVQMNVYLPWYKRLYEAFKYVFNAQHAGWDYTLISAESDEFERLQEFLSQHE